MDEHPDQPGHEPAQSNPTSLQHRKVLADDCHISLVEISEGTPRGFAFELSGNHLAYVASLLDRNLGNARQRPSLLTQDGHIADGENAATIKNGSTGSLLARSVGTPSVFTTG